LKSALVSLEKKEKTLGEDLKILEEKVAIQEIEEKVNAKRAVVEQLQKKRGTLEKKLGPTEKKPAKKVQEKEIEEPQEETMPEEYGEEPEERTEEHEMRAEELEKRLEEQMGEPLNNKKKRKWF